MSAKAKRSAQESRDAFFKEVAPAFVAARTKEEAVHLDTIPAIEKSLLRSLRSTAAAEKKCRKAAARHADRLRAQKLLT